MVLNSEPNYQVMLRTPDGSNLHVREYKKRNTHAKTRSGCLPCKSKRVKCDEGRPICDRCKRNARACSYKPGTFHAVQQDKILEDGTTSALSCLGLSAAPAWQQATNGTSNVHLVQHLLGQWIEIFHFPCDKRLLFMSTSNYLVESTLLAVSACHLRHLARGALQHQVAEYFHQGQVVRGLRRLLCVPAQNLNQSDANALIFCATLLNMITFTIPVSRDSANNHPRVSWVLESNDDCRAWLDLQIALRPLLYSTSGYIDGALNLLTPIFYGAESKRWEFKKVLAQGTTMIPLHWLNFFELKELDPGENCECTVNKNVFLDPAAILAQLRVLEPISANVFKSMQFLAKIQDGFRGLLLARDSKALWLLGYWLGLLCRFDNIWWCKERAMRDYTAICILLQQRQATMQTLRQCQLWAEMMTELFSVIP